MLFPMINFSYFYISTVRTICVVPSMAVRILQFIDVVLSRYAAQMLYKW
jgi:hypothetical protein